MNPKDAIWAEHYRPNTFDDYVFPSEEIKTKVEKWIEQGSFPNMILKGPWGTGKSTFAHILSQLFEIDPMDFMKINGSTENKIETVRERINPFTRKQAKKNGFKLVLIEEGHRLTADAQSALFEIIEHRTHCRFIFTTNYPNKFAGALKSRCPVLDFDDHVDPLDVQERLFAIAVEEGMDPDNEDNIAAIEEHYNMHSPDIRMCINSIQEALDGDVLRGPNAALGFSKSVDDWEVEWQQEDIDMSAIIDMSDTVDDNTFNEFYRVIYENIHMHVEPVHLEYIYPEISEALFKAQSTQSALQPIHLKALIYRIINIVSDDEEDGDE